MTKIDAIKKAKEEILKRNFDANDAIVEIIMECAAKLIVINSEETAISYLDKKFAEGKPALTHLENILSKMMI